MALRMEFTGAVLQLGALAVLFSGCSPEPDVPHVCGSQDEFSHLSQQLQLTADSQVLSSISKLSQTLHSHHLNECDGAEPLNCTAAQAPENGGLLCVSLNHRRFCKPLCNHGYDFMFLRSSRLFDECSEQTSYTWNSQYVGGNQLAVCSKSPVTVAGAKTAYFPKEQDCLQSKANNTLHAALMEQFYRELQSAGHQGEPHSTCHVCGHMR
ncbi:hypothetical protein WMY93_018179 [Mugilogobius chulae]|uniref:Uncharacterized protein n=1 Tax=Mugilogobius chulae TaxID=88201 RepID=A0AAW0NTB8_9GOBI